MTTTSQLAKHLRDVYFGGNWTAVNLRDVLNDISWQQATTKVYDCNTITVLVYHINYYITEVTKVLQGQPLTASDKYAFACPPVTSEQEWQQMQERVFSEAETFAAQIEKLPDSILAEDFTDKKYGSWFRNLAGIIEHMHYHLGQIVIIKKAVQAKEVS